MLKNRRVLGIDCGTAIVGWAIMEKKGKKYNVLNYGDIRTSSVFDMATRLLQIFEALEKLILEYKPTDIAIEKIFFFKNNKTIITVSEARGVIMLAGVKNGLEVFGYTPLQVKMSVTGYGRAEKKQVQFMVQKILDLKEIPKCDDTADALAISFCHLNSVK
jgi:crossover junction endodeoxyribonuclease RuvC